MSTSQRYLETRDMNLSAVLMCEGIILEFVEKDEKGIAKFFFKLSKKVESLIESYWKHKLQVDPQSLFQNLKILKNRIHSNY